MLLSLDLIALLVVHLTSLLYLGTHLQFFSTTILIAIYIKKVRILTHYRVSLKVSFFRSFQFFEHFNFFVVLHRVCPFWPLLAPFPAFLALFGPFPAILALLGPFWPLLAGFGRFWPFWPFLAFLPLFSLISIKSYSKKLKRSKI